MPLFGRSGPPDIHKLEAKRDVKGLIEALSYGQDGLLWSQAAQALGRLGDPAAARPLILCLRKIGSNLRAHVVAALVAIGAPAVEPLIAELAAHPDTSTIEALARIGDTRAVRPLVGYLRVKTRFDEEYIQDQAIDALRSLGHSAVEPLIEALQDEDSSVRLRIVKALEQQGTPQAIEALTRTLNDPVERVRTKGSEALARLGWQADSGEQQALAAIAAQDWEACVALGASAVQPLIETLQQTSAGTTAGVELKENAVLTLGRIGDSRALEPLLDALRGGNRKAAQALAAARFEDSRVEAELVAVLTVPSEAIRKAAAAALDQLGWQPASDDQKAIHSVAAQDWEACAALGSSAVEPLIAVLESHRFETANPIREQAAEVLGRIGDARAVEPLVAALKSTPGAGTIKLITCAADALGEIGGNEAIAALADALYYDRRESIYDGDIRHRAEAALRRIGTPMARAALEQAGLSPD